MRDKVSGAIAIPQASWGCAPALPNRTQWVYLRIMIFNDEPQANKKFFDPAIFQKCWRGVGEQPTFAEQTCFQEPFFLLQLHFLKLSNSQFDDFYETSYKFEQGNGAIAARWQAKAGVEPPFAGCGRLFSLEISFLGNKPQENKKFFDAAVFQKCCRGVGEQPTFAEQICFCNFVFLLQLHFLKLSHSQFDIL